jgi:hypothetical protein
MSVNKLTSPQVLASMDFTSLPFLRDMVQRSVSTSGTTTTSSASTTTDTAAIQKYKNHDTSPWKAGLNSAHGDVVYTLGRQDVANRAQELGELPQEYVWNVRVLQDVYCGQLGVLDLSETVDADDAAAWTSAIFRDFRLNFLVDNMPVAYVVENDQFVTKRYTGGVPVGEVVQVSDGTVSGTTNDMAVMHNHWNLQLQYRTVQTVAGDRYRVVRATVQAFSIQHEIANTGASTFPVTLQNPIPSCQPVVAFNPGTLQQKEQQQQRRHTSYDMLSQSAVSPQPVSGKVLFTYDVEWISLDNPDQNKATTNAASKNNDLTVNNRWNIFLSMDGATPTVVLWMGLLIGVFINCLLAGALWTWVMRDLSYKPLYDSTCMEEFETMVEPETSNVTATTTATTTPSDATELQDHDVDDLAPSPQAAQEIQLWPLSSLVFFPPTCSAGALAVACGTGAQLWVSCLFFLLLFQTGIVNQSLGANILTPCVILYTISSLVGGYVTGRLLAVFHKSQRDAIKACLLVATVYPVIGMVTIHMVYDVLPGSTAPDYRVLAHSGLLMTVWLLAVVPLTVAGGVWGHRGGALTQFPVASDAAGYQDLALQPADGSATEDENVAVWYSCRRNKCRMPLLLLTGGILPVICCFIEYSYGVAGPIYRDYYSEYRFGLVTFLLFCTCAGLVTMLLYYGQLRVNNYSWWWASFATGASSGIYIFILSMSWLFSQADVDVSSIGIYFLWFAFWSLGVSLMTGFVGVACCVEFNRLLYYNAMRRGHD